jgi:hypothetical protein
MVGFVMIPDSEGGGSGTNVTDVESAGGGGASDGKDLTKPDTVKDSYDNSDSSPALKPSPPSPNGKSQDAEKKQNDPRELGSVTVKAGVFMPGMKVDPKTGQIKNEASLSELKTFKELAELAKKGNAARKVGPYGDVGIEVSNGKIKSVDISAGLGASLLARAYVKVKIPVDANEGESTRLMFGASAAETVEAEVDVAEVFDRIVQAAEETTAAAFEKLYAALGAPTLFVDPKKPLHNGH